MEGGVQRRLRTQLPESAFAAGRPLPRQLPEARVTGRVVAPRFMLAEGAAFNGRVEPQHLDAALSVARHRRAGTTDDAATPPVTPA